MVPDPKRQQPHSPPRPERSHTSSLCPSAPVQSLSNHHYEPACFDQSHTCTKKPVYSTAGTNTSATASPTASGSPGSQSAHSRTRKRKHPCHVKWCANKPSTGSHKSALEPAPGTRRFFQLPSKHATSWTTTDSTAVTTYFCSQFKPIS